MISITRKMTRITPWSRPTPCEEKKEFMSSATTRLNIPVANWFDPVEAMADPYPQYEELRALGPVVHAPAVGRVFVTNHAAVSEAEHHPEIFSSYSETNLTMMRAIGAR